MSKQKKHTQPPASEEVKFEQGADKERTIQQAKRDEASALEEEEAAKKGYLNERIKVEVERGIRENLYEKSVNLWRIRLGVYLHVIVITFFTLLLLFILGILFLVVAGIWFPCLKTLTEDIQKFLMAFLPYMVGLAVVLVSRPSALLKTFIERFSDSSR